MYNYRNKTSLYYDQTMQHPCLDIHSSFNVEANRLHCQLQLKMVVSNCAAVKLTRDYNLSSKEIFAKYCIFEL